MSLYAPERPRRRLAVLRRQARLVRAARRAGSARRRRRASSLVLGGDFNVAPTDADVWDAAAVHGGTHVSEPERAAFRALLDCGPRRRLPGAPPRRTRPLHVVGLPGRDVPQELRDADRPPAASRRPWPHASSMPRSTARRARARRSRPTTRRCSSTSTNQAARSTPTGKAPWPGSRQEQSRRAVEPRIVAPDGAGEGATEHRKRAHLRVRERGAQVATHARAVRRHADVPATTP